MDVHNVRSPEQWEIINHHIDFKGKTVLDLGCGKGDLLFRAFETGARVTGVDKDEENVEHIRSVCPEIEVIEDAIEDLPVLSGLDVQHDIIICFSVLPYLRGPGYTLTWINAHSEVALIECQYSGDGPGFHFLWGNDEMKSWLLEVGQFAKVQNIGHTLVEGRNKKRFIWMCE